MIRSKTVYAEAELDLWSDDEIIEEMKARGYTCVKHGSEPVMLNAEEVYLAWKKKRSDAQEKMERFVLEAAGRIA